MALITEAIARKNYEKEKNIIVCSRADKFTPSAREFITDRGIELKFIEDGALDTIIDKALSVEKQDNEISASVANEVNEKPKQKYICKYTGGVLDYKPEHMTQLHNNVLVYKFDKRVELRGKLDSLQANFIDASVQLDGNEEFFNDFDDLIVYVKSILTSEFTNQTLSNLLLLGLTDNELREHSHDPKKYFGCDHLFGIDRSFNRKTILLNRLRAEVREVEILAVKTFFKEGVVEREDIIKALNRLSSGVYLAMLKAESGRYE